MKTEHNLRPLLGAALGARITGGLPVLAAVGGFAAALITAPSYSSFAAHDDFSSLFSTAAAVVATLFVGFALGARYYMASGWQAAMVLLMVALAEVASLLGLSPSLPHGWYQVLLAVTVGGGAGALAAALLSAARIASGDYRSVQDKAQTMAGNGAA